MKDEVILKKSEQIERCIVRIREEYTGYEKEFETNQTKQDAIILNIQRACEIAIDLAAHVVRIKKLGIPDNARDCFLLLEKAKVISTELGKKLQNMVGFRNVVVHEYDQINLEITKSIIEHHLDDFVEFIKILLKD